MRLAAQPALLVHQTRRNSRKTEAIFTREQNSGGVVSSFSTKENIDSGRVQRLMPIILALWETEVGRSLKVRSLRPTWATW